MSLMDWIEPAIERRINSLIDTAEATSEFRAHDRIFTENLKSVLKDVPDEYREKLHELENQLTLMVAETVKYCYRAGIQDGMGLNQGIHNSVGYANLLK